MLPASCPAWPRCPRYRVPSPVVRWWSASQPARACSGIGGGRTGSRRSRVRPFGQAQTTASPATTPNLRQDERGWGELGRDGVDRNELSREKPGCGELGCGELGWDEQTCGAGICEAPDTDKPGIRTPGPLGLAPNGRTATIYPGVSKWRARDGAGDETRPSSPPAPTTSTSDTKVASAGADRQSAMPNTPRSRARSRASGAMRRPSCGPAGPRGLRRQKRLRVSCKVIDRCRGTTGRRHHTGLHREQVVNPTQPVVTTMRMSWATPTAATAATATDSSKRVLSGPDRLWA